MSNVLHGHITGFDEFGNAFTDIPSSNFAKAHSGTPNDWSIALGDSVNLMLKTVRAANSSKNQLPTQKLVDVPVLSGAYCACGEPCLILRASSEFAILTIRRKSAKDLLNLQVGDGVTVILMSAGKYFERQNAYSFEQLFDSSKYARPEDFANFRPVPGCNLVYRASSPFDNMYLRRDCCAKIAEIYEINAILDMADTSEELAALIPACSTYMKELYGLQHIVTAGDDSGFKSDNFASLVVFGLSQLLYYPRPWLIHCRAGKRRSGFVCAILAALAGASYSEITHDYMLSYVNNNGVSPDRNLAQYETLRRDTIIAMMQHIANATGALVIDPQLANWGDICARFLVKFGMIRPEVEQLRRAITTP